MATAALSRRARMGANSGAVASESESMQFLIVEDNGGGFHWALLDRAGNSLAQSPRYASYQDAESAARALRADAGSAQLDRRGAIDGPSTSPTKRRSR